MACVNLNYFSLVGKIETCAQPPKGVYPAMGVYPAITSSVKKENWSAGKEEKVLE